MKKTVTIRDVAALAQVSVGTVSMVLNKSIKVSPHTRTAVLGAVEKLGYVRNPFARSFSLSKSSTVGVVVTDLTNPFFGMMVKHLQQEVLRRDYKLMLNMTENSVQQEQRMVEGLINNGVDGLIIVPAHERNPDISHIYDLLGRKKPVVFISSHYPGIETNCVMTNLAKGSYDLTTHFLQTGHRNMMLISGFRGLVLSEQRIEGFFRAHRDLGVATSEDQIVEADPDYDGGYLAAKQILTSGRHPDGIMAANDLLCMGMLSCFREEGVRVPGDVSIAGYDDLIYSSMLDIPLTTVRQPIKRMCKEAVEILFALIAGEEVASQPLLLDPTLMIRSSTRKG